ncbi:MAG: ATP-binding protein [Nocardioidaceae bacterium]
MYPARTSSRWLGTSASAGSSRSVRTNRVDIRMTRGLPADVRAECAVSWGAVMRRRLPSEAFRPHTSFTAGAGSLVVMCLGSRNYLGSGATLRHHAEVPTRGAGLGSAVRARFAAHPASVPGVRWFVAHEVGTWGLPSLVDDAELCVSELAGNAARHSNGRFMEVALESLDHGVRISVEDDGGSTLDAVAPRFDYTDVELADPDLLPVVEEDVDLEPTQGRGLAIVTFLADDWGVDRTETGKRVWVELRHSPAAGPGVPTQPPRATR